MNVLEYLRGRGVRLSMATHRSFKCLCPLPGHNDRDPSFYVYTDQEQNWYCFGCQRGGDVWTLVQHMESVGFRKACEIVGRSPDRVQKDEVVLKPDRLAPRLSSRVRRLMLAATVRTDLLGGTCSFEEADERYKALLRGYDVGQEE